MTDVLPYLDHVTTGDLPCPVCHQLPCVGLVLAARGAVFPPDAEFRLELADPAPWRWLESTVALQRDFFGQGTGDRSTSEIAASIKDNSFAIFVELAEMAVEYSWKHWATDEPFVNRERVLKEAVDVGHFLANILVANGITDAEYEAAYQAKQEINRERMRSKTYSAKKGGLGEGSD